MKKFKGPEIREKISCRFCGSDLFTVEYLKKVSDFERYQCESDSFYECKPYCPVCRHQSFFLIHPKTLHVFEFKSEAALEAELEDESTLKGGN